eukprot:TRINITY_DN21100_c0_g1_i3.p1 TRINITY_DN21100_c0_g1~~TRINITY_DN21100_c0_g1_i3.p1  ORF type:complete len:721 (-),score=47.51 TRINITY_DN21100_c0_g1_i3:49-2052(-)
MGSDILESCIEFSYLGLRAVAVVAVLVFHCRESWLAGGWIGVDIFYVISGYVVTGSMICGRVLCSIDGLASFYARRVQRLVPNSMCTILVTGLLVCLFVPKWGLGWDDPLQNIYKSGTYATFAAANVLYGLQRASYWDTGADSLAMNPYTHMWSLGVEEQFYLIYPLFLLLLHGGRAPTLENLRSYRWSQTFLVICIVSSLVAYQQAAGTLPEAAFYFLPFRFWELAVGAWVYMLQASYGEKAWRGLTTNCWVHLPTEFLAVACIGAAICIPSRRDFSDLTRMCTGVMGAVCCILANSNPDGILKRMLAINFMVGLGKMSYSLYLWHWPIFTLFRWTVGLDSAVCVFFSLFTTGAFAFSAYHGVEKPVRRQVVSKWTVLFALIVGAAVCRGTLVALSRSEFTVVPPMCASAHGSVNAPSMTAMLRSQTSGRCFSSEEAISRISTTPARTILVVGDSHADAASVALYGSQPVRELYNIKLMNLSCWGFTEAVDGHCKGVGLPDPSLFREKVFKEAKKLRANDILVLSKKTKTARLFESDLIRKLQRLVVRDRNASFLFYGDNPELNAGMDRCVPTWIRPNAASSCQTSVSDQRLLQSQEANLVKNLARELPSTYVFERWPLYCNSETCDGFIPGTCTIAYLDAHHLTYEGKVHSSPFICSFMDEHMLL